MTRPSRFTCEGLACENRCLESGTVEWNSGTAEQWNSGMVGGAGLLNKLAAKCVSWGFIC